MTSDPNLFAEIKKINQPSLTFSAVLMRLFLEGYNGTELEQKCECFSVVGVCAISRRGKPTPHAGLKLLSKRSWRTGVSRVEGRQTGASPPADTFTGSSWHPANYITLLRDSCHLHLVDSSVCSVWFLFNRYFFPLSAISWSAAESLPPITIILWTGRSNPGCLIVTFSSPFSSPSSLLPEHKKQSDLRKLGGKEAEQ